tara:strand:+ start:863 stop:1135 length:273 start_codon:yes stop_codon:yes gene_type:complete
MDTHTQNDSNNPINYNGKTKCCDICGIEEYKTYFVDDTQICEDCIDEDEAVEEIVIFTSYIINDEGNIIYDFDIIREDFENELLKLKNNY